MPALPVWPARVPVLKLCHFFVRAATEQGASHHIAQAEGCEPGGRLMPALYSLAQHPVLQGQLRDGEAIFAYFDDTYIIAPPEWVHELYTQRTRGRALWAHVRIELNCRKTRVWNAAGEESPGMSALQGQADAAVWVGPPRPTGSHDSRHVQQRLEAKREEHDGLLHPSGMVVAA